MKKIIFLIATVMLLAGLTACGLIGGGDSDVLEREDPSDWTFIGENRLFESQEAAEAILTARDVPFTVVEAGPASGHSWRNECLAIIDDARSRWDVFSIGVDAQSGYYVPNDETVILLVYTSVEGEPTLGESELYEYDGEYWIFLGDNYRFRTQSAAEDMLNARGIPFTVIDGGQRSVFDMDSDILAEVDGIIAYFDIEYPDDFDGRPGFYVIYGETVLLRVYTDPWGDEE